MKLPSTLKILPTALLLTGCLFPSLLTSVSAHAQNLPILGDTEREDLSPQMERKLGEQIMQSIRLDPDYLDDPVVSEYLNKIGNKLLAARPEARGETVFDFEFFAVRDPVLNAFALPGGFIGVHSGLLLTAQTESELAGVLGHEIGHVQQRHIARMIGAQKQDALIPLAALILAALAMRSSPDAAMAVAIGGQGVAIQRQMSFSRDAEREADRMGFQTMRDAGFDTTAMATFFGRLQTAMRNYTDNAPAYLRSHPLTTERIADMQARQQNERYRQHQDSLDFFLMRSRVRVLQEDTTQGWYDSLNYFDSQWRSGNLAGKIAAKYGMAFVAYRQKDYGKAQSLLDEAGVLAKDNASYQNDLKECSAFASLAIDIRLAQKEYPQAVALAAHMQEAYPFSRGIAHQYANALIENKQPEKASAFLRDQIQLYHPDSQIYALLAKSYSAEGKLALQHIALADSYALGGSLPAAILQLDLARKTPDVSYFDQSVIDAKEREWKEKRKDEIADEKKNKN
jgi:predicted Zn-dependent protease